MQSLGVVSEMIGIPVATLKYYDREGLFGDLPRDTGIRMFGDKEIEIVRVIECLRESGLEIEQIKRFLRPEITSEEKLENFRSHRQNIEERIEALERIRDLLDFQCWYYEQVLELGDEAKVDAMIPDSLPKKVREMYDRGREGSVRAAGEENQ